MGAGWDEGTLIKDSSLRLKMGFALISSKEICIFIKELACINFKSGVNGGWL